jgi:hypothetical protein
LFFPLLQLKRVEKEGRKGKEGRREGRKEGRKNGEGRKDGEGRTIVGPYCLS